MWNADQEVRLYNIYIHTYYAHCTYLYLLILKYVNQLVETFNGRRNDNREAYNIIKGYKLINQVRCGFFLSVYLIFFFDPTSMNTYAINE